MNTRRTYNIAIAYATGLVVGLFVVIGLSPYAAAQSLSETEQQIVNYVEAHNDEAIDFLARTVNMNSGTMNHEGVRAVAEVYREELDALGFETRWVSLPDSVNRAGHLFATRSGDRGRRLLLIGHLDTVFEEDSPFQRFERQSDTLATGPAVNDMKGGNALVLYALKALDAAGALDGAHVTVAFTGDEEKARPAHQREPPGAHRGRAGERRGPRV